MAAYLILIIVILMKNIPEKIFGKKGYLFFCCAAFILVYGLSSESIGLNDRQQVYNRVFELCKATGTLSEVVQLAQSRVSSGIMFYIITWVISRFVSDYNIFLFIMGIPFNVAVTYYIGKYSKDSRLSFLVYLALIYPLTFTVVRQCVAMSLLIIAMESLHQDNWKKAIILILLASTIHLTALAFLLVVIFRQKKYYCPYLLIIPICLLISMSGGNIVFRWINILITNETYLSKYSTANGVSMAIAAIVIRIAILLFLFFGYKTKDQWFPQNNTVITQTRKRFKVSIRKVRPRKRKIVSTNSRSSNESVINFTEDGFLWGATLSTVFVCLMNLIGEFQRIATYFDILFIISIPNVLSSFKKRERILITILISILLIVYFLAFQLDNWKIANYAIFYE